MKTMRNRVVGAEESISVRNQTDKEWPCNHIRLRFAVTKSRTCRLRFAHNYHIHQSPDSQSVVNTRHTISWWTVREVYTERVGERVILSELIERSYNHVPTPRCRSLESDTNTTSDNSYSFENKNSPRSYPPMSRTLGLLRRSKWQTISVLTLLKCSYRSTIVYYKHKIRSGSFIL